MIQKSKVELHCYFLLKVRCYHKTTQAMNILLKEIGSLEAVNLSGRDVQSQFIVCSPKLTFSLFVWFYAGVSVGSMPQSPPLELWTSLKEEWERVGSTWLCRANKLFSWEALENLFSFFFIFIRGNQLSFYWALDIVQHHDPTHSNIFQKHLIHFLACVSSVLE